MDQKSEQGGVHREVFAGGAGVFSGGRHELRELPVDDLGGVEGRDHANEIAREHAVEQQIELVGCEFDTRFDQCVADLRLGGHDGRFVLGDARFLVGDLAGEAVDGVGQDAGQHGLLRRGDLLFAQRDDARFEIANIAAVRFDALLHLHDGSVRHDGKRGIEELADARFAILARFRPERRDEELILARKLLGLRALFGDVGEDSVDGRHEGAGLLVAELALARVDGCMVLDGCKRLLGAQQVIDFIGAFGRGLRLGSGRRSRHRNCGDAERHAAGRANELGQMSLRT